MKLFEEYTRKAIVIVPSEDSYKERLALSQKEDQKEIPAELINDMKSNFFYSRKIWLFKPVNFLNLISKFQIAEQHRL